MNEIKGGQQFIRCALVNSEDEMVTNIIAYGDTLEEAMLALAQGTPSGLNAVDCETYTA